MANGKEKIEAALAAPSPGGRRRRSSRDVAQALYHEFLVRLRRFRVLDPACGSGNFLYLGLQALKDLEHQASIEAAALGLQREFPQVGPETMLTRLRRNSRVCQSGSGTFSGRGSTVSRRQQIQCYNPWKLSNAATPC